MRRALLLFPLLLSVVFAASNNSMATFFVKSVVGTIFFAAGAFAVYAIATAFNSVIASAVAAIVGGSLLEGTLSLVLVMLGTVGVVFAMWLIVKSMLG